MNVIFTRFRKHYLPILALAIFAVAVFFIALTKRDTITLIAQSTGYISLGLLSVSLIIGPVNIILKHKNPISTYFRRDLSITGGVLAVIHSVTGLFVHLRGQAWLYFMQKTENGYSIRLDNFGLANYTGLLSTLIIILLIITSNDYFLRKLNPVRWKNIQRFSYLMFCLALAHCFYYRLVKENLILFYRLYTPLFIIVLTFQLAGIWLQIIKQRTINTMNK